MLHRGGYIHTAQSAVEGHSGMIIPKNYSDFTLSLALSLSAAAWGLYWIPLRAIEEVGFAGAWSAVFFNACPLLVLVPLLVLARKRFTTELRPCLFAALMIGIAFSLYANGLLESTVMRATLLFYITPIWSTIIGVIWLSERLTTARVISIILGFLGLLLLLSNNDNEQHPLNIGDLYGVLSGIFWAIGIATLNKWSNIPLLPLATYTFLSTTLISAVFAITFYGNQMPNFKMTKAAFLSSAFWSIIVLMPCFCIIFEASKRLFPGRVGILMMSEVIFALVSASFLIPEESMQLLQWFGALGILFAGLVEVLYGFNREAGSVNPTMPDELKH